MGPAMTLYAQLASRGLEFGERFRGVEQVWVGAGEALGKIVARGEEASGLGALSVVAGCLSAGSGSGGGWGRRWRTVSAAEPGAAGDIQPSAGACDAACLESRDHTPPPRRHPRRRHHHHQPPRLLHSSAYRTSDSENSKRKRRTARHGCIALTGVPKSCLASPQS